MAMAGLGASRVLLLRGILGGEGTLSLKQGAVRGAAAASFGGRGEREGGEGAEARKSEAGAFASQAAARKREAGAAVVLAGETQAAQSEYKNVDGHRHDDGRYAAFMESVRSKVNIPQERIITDAVRTYAYGTDASFYRLVPKIVVKVHNEEEVSRILVEANKHQTPVTFRAAGTSLSGQAVTDSVLLKLSHTGDNFRKYTIHGDGEQITVEPGLIGGEINRLLAAHRRANKLPQQYKIGPDPSSIDSCMIGGIIANNSSGMCCGVSQNTYHTLKDMRIVLLDGTVLDTADEASCSAFMKSHAHLVSGVVDLATRVQADEELAALIRRKFSIKCTTGYSLNALVDFPPSDPIEIIKRLMIGSEGTLGFISRATINTVPEYDHKASAFVVFPTVRDACQAAAVLRTCTRVDAVELFDTASLRECEGNARMRELVPDIIGCDEGTTALLIECRGQDKEMMYKRIAEVQRAIDEADHVTVSGPGSVSNYPFTEDKDVYGVYWDVRKGLIPIVGAARETGTSMLIEDVACDVNKLGDMMEDLIEMFKRHKYHDASCFGHALEGNLHLVFSQGFRNEEEIERYSLMMEELCEIVADKYGGSLKAEHSTGRNVAPFVEMEWGAKATSVMWELKKLFDPNGVLNPGVVLNEDEDVHKKALKASPPADNIVDRCIECGFCESNCPSRDLSLTPRQRITVYREMSRLRALGPDELSPEDSMRLREFETNWTYNGEQTCAADGMCQEKCPVKINTGELIKTIRSRNLAEGHATELRAADFAARNWGTIDRLVPTALTFVTGMTSVLGDGLFSAVSRALNKASGGWVPVWNHYMPTGAKSAEFAVAAPAAERAPAEPAARLEPAEAIYLMACPARTMGPARTDATAAGRSVPQVLRSLADKAQVDLRVMQDATSLCCGLSFSSRGLQAAAESKSDEMVDALVKATDNGRIPVICDTSPCMAHIQHSAQAKAPSMQFLDPVEFTQRVLAPRLDFANPRDEAVAIHVPCSSKKLGLEASFASLVTKCCGGKEPVPSGVPCCGMAGDRGLRYPQLTASSLQHLKLPETVKDGYSTSRTCEISLSNHSGVHFRNVLYLVDEVTAPKKQAA